MKEKHLDKYDIGAAILTGDEAIEAATLANPYYADALCRAYNDYMIDYWLPKDERFWGRIVVAPQDPQLAAAEIRSSPKNGSAMRQQALRRPILSSYI